MTNLTSINIDILETCDICMENFKHNAIKCDKCGHKLCTKCFNTMKFGISSETEKVYYVYKCAICRNDVNIYLEIFNKTDILNMVSIDYNNFTTRVKDYEALSKEYNHLRSIFTISMAYDDPKQGDWYKMWCDYKTLKEKLRLSELDNARLIDIEIKYHNSLTEIRNINNRLQDEVSSHNDTKRLYNDLVAKSINTVNTTKNVVEAVYVKTIDNVLKLCNKNKNKTVNKTKLIDILTTKHNIVINI